MIPYLTVRELIEQLQHCDLDANVEIEVRHEETHSYSNQRDQVNSWTDNEPLVDIHQRMEGNRYVTLRG
jgi:hypothetical protein